MTDLRIEPVPGYAPTIGRLVWMLTYVRRTLRGAVNGLSQGQLDHLHDAKSNSIGALLSHVGAVERYYQVVTLADREPTPDENVRWAAALELGDAGRRELRGRELRWYLDDLDAARKVTLAGLARRDDEWLEKPLGMNPRVNPHWAWFHVAEDELNHRGQIRWLRARLTNLPGDPRALDDVMI